MFSKLFKSGKQPPRIEGYAKLNMRLQPKTRGVYFEDPLVEALEAAKLGTVTGGGTHSSEARVEDGHAPGGAGGLEIQWCAIDVVMTEAQRSAELICNTLNQRWAAKGSQLEFYINDERFVADFGVTEGIAVYLQGTGLPMEVYKAHTIESVARRIDELIEPESGGRGAVFDFWHGTTESAMYIYGRTAELMTSTIRPLLAEHPLCQGSRVVTIA